MAQTGKVHSTWLLDVHKILEDIKYFLKNDLSEECLSDFSNKRRLDLLSKLGDLSRAPSLPPRRIKSNRGNEYPNESSSTHKPLTGNITDNCDTKEFINKEGDESRNWTEDKADEVSGQAETNIYERISSIESAGEHVKLQPVVKGVKIAHPHGTTEDNLMPPPHPERRVQKQIPHTTLCKKNDSPASPVLIGSLKDSSWAGPLIDFGASKKFWAVLHIKKLYFFESLDASAHEVLSMEEYEVHTGNAQKTAFNLIKPGFSSYLLGTDNLIDTTNWISALKSCNYIELDVSPGSKDALNGKQNDDADAYLMPQIISRKPRRQRSMKVQEEVDNAATPPIPDKERRPSYNYVDMTSGSSDWNQIHGTPIKTETNIKIRPLPPIPDASDAVFSSDRDETEDIHSDNSNLSGGFESVQSDIDEDRSDTVASIPKFNKTEEKSRKVFDFFHDLDAVYCGILHQKRILAVWRRRYCKLKDDSLICWQNPDDTEKPVTHVPLKGCKLADAKEIRRDTAFKLRKPNGDELYFAAETREQLMVWLTTIAQVIENNRLGRRQEQDEAGDGRAHSQSSLSSGHDSDSCEYQSIDENFDGRFGLRRKSSGSDFDADKESDLSSGTEDDKDEGNKKRKSSDFGTVKSKIRGKLKKKNRMSPGSSDDLEDADADIRGYLYRFKGAQWCREWSVIKHKKLLLYKEASLHRPGKIFSLENATLFTKVLDERGGEMYNLFELKYGEHDTLTMSSEARVDMDKWISTLILQVKTVNREKKQVSLPLPVWLRGKQVQNGASLRKLSKQQSGSCSETKSADVTKLPVSGKFTEIKYKSGRAIEIERWFVLAGGQLKIFASEACRDTVHVIDLDRTIIRCMKVEDKERKEMFSFEFVTENKEKTVDVRIQEEMQKTLIPALWASEAQLLGFETMTLNRRKKYLFHNKDDVSGSFDKIQSIHSSKDALSENNDEVGSFQNGRRTKAASVPENILQESLPGLKDNARDFISGTKIRSSVQLGERNSPGNRVTKLFKSLTADRRLKKNKYLVTLDGEEKEKDRVPFESHPKEQFNGFAEEITKRDDGTIVRTRRHCRISGKIFYVFELENLRRPIFKVPLRSASLEDRIDMDSNLFTITITSMENNRELTFALSSEQELDTWVNAMNETNFISQAQSSKESLLSDDSQNKAKESDESLKKHIPADANTISSGTVNRTSSTSDEPKNTRRDSKRSKEVDNVADFVCLEGYLFECKSTTTKIRQWVVLKKTKLEVYESKRSKNPRVFVLSEYSFSVGNPDEKREKLKLILKSDRETITFVCSDRIEHKKWAKEFQRARRSTLSGTDSAKALFRTTNGALKQFLQKNDQGKSKRATLFLDEEDQEAVEKYVDFLRPVNSFSGALRQVLNDGRTKPRFCAIQNNFFNICKSNKPDRVIRKIDLSEVTVVDESDSAAGKFFFKLDEGNGKNAIFECQDAQSADRWMVAVSMAMFLDKLQLRKSGGDPEECSSDYGFLPVGDEPVEPRKRGSSSTIQERIGSVKSSVKPKGNEYKKSSSAGDLLIATNVRENENKIKENSRHSLSDLTLTTGERRGSSVVSEELQETTQETGSAFDSFDCEKETDTENKVPPPVLSGRISEPPTRREVLNNPAAKVEDLQQNKEFLESEKYTLQRCLAELKTVVEESRSRRKLSRSYSTSSVQMVIEDELRTAKSDLQKMKKRLIFVEKELKKVNNEINRRYNRSYLEQISSAKGSHSDKKWYTDTTMKETDERNMYGQGDNTHHSKVTKDKDLIV